jgi:protein phosphatase
VLELGGAGDEDFAVGIEGQAGAVIRFRHSDQSPLNPFSDSMRAHVAFAAVPLVASAVDAATAATESWRGCARFFRARKTARAALIFEFWRRSVSHINSTAGEVEVKRERLNHCDADRADLAGCRRTSYDLALSSPARLRSVAMTDRGRRRPLNEDAFERDDALGLYVVADGVGGHAKGEIASRESVEQIHGFMRQGRSAVTALLGEPALAEHRESVRRLLESAVQSACYMVYGLAELDPAQKGMSTTISALLLAGVHGFVAQVGDSRVYRIRDGVSQQLTEDHTLVNYKLKQGLISEAEARTMKGKNVITRAVGHKDYVEVDTREVDIRVGDVFVLCSDGLHGYLQPGELERIVGATAIDDAPARLVQLANERGGRDNITVVLAYVQ